MHTPIHFRILPDGRLDTQNREGMLREPEKAEAESIILYPVFSLLYSVKRHMVKAR
jgi:hypothetical protein